MMSKKYPGILCPDCGCRLDPQEQCDCERVATEKRTELKKSKNRKSIVNNMRAVEQSMIEWEYA